MSEKIIKALYVVATPIGNLQDISARARHVLTNVDVIAAEDTRHTKQLLMHFGLQAKLIAVHQHNERHAADGIVKLLAEGKSVALVSDAGTPGISDPGAPVVAAVAAAGFQVVPIPGASALAAAVSASGEGEHGFLFHGFLPAKAGERRRVLEALQALPYVIVFYESPHRIVESVAAMAEVFGETRTLVVCRELTKKFETIKRLALAEAVAWLEADENNQRGEFVLVLSALKHGEDQDRQNAEDARLERTLGILLAQLPLKQAVQIAAELTGLKKNAVYAQALAMRAGREE